MPWGLSFGESIALALLCLVAAVLFGPERAVRAIRALRRNGHEHHGPEPQRRTGKPFVFEKVPVALPSGSVEAEEMHEVKANLARLERLIVGPEGVIQQLGALKVTISSQPTRQDLAAMQTRLADEMAAGFREIREWLRTRA